MTKQLHCSLFLMALTASTAHGAFVSGIDTFPGDFDSTTWETRGQSVAPASPGLRFSDTANWSDVCSVAPVISIGQRATYSIAINSIADNFLIAFVLCSDEANTSIYRDSVGVAWTPSGAVAFSNLSGLATPSDWSAIVDGEPSAIPATDIAGKVTVGQHTVEMVRESEYDWSFAVDGMSTSIGTEAFNGTANIALCVSRADVTWKSVEISSVPEPAGLLLLAFPVVLLRRRH